MIHAPGVALLKQGTNHTFCSKCTSVPTKASRSNKTGHEEGGGFSICFVLMVLELLRYDNLYDDNLVYIQNSTRFKRFFLIIIIIWICIT